VLVWRFRDFSFLFHILETEGRWLMRGLALNWLVLGGYATLDWRGRRKLQKNRCRDGKRKTTKKDGKDGGAISAFFHHPFFSISPSLLSSRVVSYCFFRLASIFFYIFFFSFFLLFGEQTCRIGDGLSCHEFWRLRERVEWK